MRTIHKVCTKLLRIEHVTRNTKGPWPKCKECPRHEKIDGMVCVRGCRLGAEEMVSIIKFGQPWGRKYRHSRKSWPDRSGYTDKFSRERNKRFGVVRSQTSE